MEKKKKKKKKLKKGLEYAENYNNIHTLSSEDAVTWLFKGGWIWPFWLISKCDIMPLVSCSSSIDLKLIIKQKNIS